MPSTSLRSPPPPGPDFLASTRFLDSDSPAVRRFAQTVTAGEDTPVGRAIKLFYAVRDQWRYDPFSMRLTPDAYIASRVLEAPAAYCIPKAILLAAAARSVAIPAGIGLADVVNHLTTPKLRERLGGRDYFMHHGYAALYLEGTWIKAAPTFNRELCIRFGVRPTEFDGRADALFQEFDAHDRRHMEYVADHGIWPEFPFDMVMADFRAFYPPTAFADGSGERFEEGALRSGRDAG